MKSQTALLIGISLMVALNLFALSTDFFRNTYDGETHLFFADHYQKAWFNSLEERWFGGFSVWSHPPLVHQLVALLGFPIGIENAYKILQGLGLAALPAAMWFFARELTNERVANFAALGTAFVAGIYTSLYVFGKLPTFTAMPLVLVACTFLARYLKSGRKAHLAAWALLGGAAVATHHHSVFTVLPFLSAAVVACNWFSCHRIDRETLARTALAAGTIIGAAVLVLLPFWWWFFAERLPVAEIPHPSRDNLFQSKMAAQMFFGNMYGGMFLLMPAALWAMARRRAARPIGALLALLFLLGLGGLTPLPKLFGPWWKVLTYDNFALWAALLLLIPAGVALEAWGFSRWATRGAMAVVGAVALGWVMYAATFTTGTNQFPRLAAWEEQEIVRFLEDDNHEDWNYITLGMGEPQFARISRLTGARTIDGFYYTARWREEQRQSGVGMIDTSIWSRKESRPFVLSVLRKPWEWNLKWAIVAQREWDTDLKRSGWEPVHPIGSDARYQPGDPMHSKVWVWRVRDDISVPPIQQGEHNTTERPRILAIWWGVMPLLALVSAIGAALFAECKNRTRAS